MHMKRETESHDLFLVDERNLARNIRVAIEHDPAIKIQMEIKGFIDENGVYRSFVGQLIPNEDSIDFVKMLPR